MLSSGMRRGDGPNDGVMVTNHAGGLGVLSHELDSGIVVHEDAWS